MDETDESMYLSAVLEWAKQLGEELDGRGLHDKKDMGIWQALLDLNSGIAGLAAAKKLPECTSSLLQRNIGAHELPPWVDHSVKFIVSLSRYATDEFEGILDVPPAPPEMVLLDETARKVIEGLRARDRLQIEQQRNIAAQNKRLSSDLSYAWSLAFRSATQLLDIVPFEVPELKPSNLRALEAKGRRLARPSLKGTVAFDNASVQPDVAIRLANDLCIE